MSKTIVFLRLLCSGILMFLFHHQGLSQYSEAEMIHKIRSFQIQADDFYDSGLFPSQRRWSFSGKSVEDNTVFFTASILSTLQMLNDELDEESRETVDLMRSQADPVYSKYKNRNGGVTYNFWQTVSPDLPFPNGSKLISNEKTRLPDDFDTTVLIALSNEKNDSSDALIKEEMISYSGRKSRNKVKLITPDEYQTAIAYETWFGKDMPQTFDLCIMSNVLLYVINRGFEWNKYDSATASLIEQMISNDDHLMRTSDVSHHSDSPALVLYHVSRLIAADNQGLLDGIRGKVISDLVGLLEEVAYEMEKVMIISSLHRLAYETHQTVDFDKLEEEAKSYSVFSVNPFSISKGRSRYVPSMIWVSEAYNLTLVLELFVLEKRLTETPVKH